MRKILSSVFSTALFLCLIGCSFNAPYDIIMPYSIEEYENGDWTGEKLVEHFETLGFHHIKVTTVPEYFGNYEQEIINVYFEIDSETSVYDFNKGDVLNSMDKVYIRYYYTPDALTIDECPDLAEILLGSDDSELMDYMAFAKKYDGEYIRFDGYVYSTTTFLGEEGHSIYVGGGDYTENGPGGYYIKIGDISNPSGIDKSVKEGQHVRVYGKIDESWSAYYDTVYVETYAMEAR